MPKGHKHIGKLGNRSGVWGVECGWEVYSQKMRAVVEDVVFEARYLRCLPFLINFDCFRNLHVSC